MQKSNIQLNYKNQAKFNQKHPNDTNLLQIDGLAKLMEGLDDDMSNVEIDDGSEDEKKNAPKKEPAPAGPDTSVFDNSVAESLGIPVDAQEKENKPSDVTQVALEDDSEEGLTLPENTNTQTEEKTDLDQSSIMLETNSEETQTETKKKDDDENIPSDGGASDISNEEALTVPSTSPPTKQVEKKETKEEPQATESSSSSETPAAPASQDTPSSDLTQTEDEVAATKKKFAALQANMEANIAEVEDNRAKQQKEFENQNSDDPADQLHGLMSAQASLKRMTSKFGAQSVQEKLSNFGQKLGIEVPQEIAKLGNNEAISSALVELAVGMGKSEDEIAAALG